MRSRYPANTLEILLRHCYTAPICQRYTSRRPFATETRSSRPDHEAKDIAVLGGGITGLASAFYLSQRLPNARITLFESSSRLGGWLQSTKIDVGNGKVVFEQGPRSIRPNWPNGHVTLDLIRELGLEDEVLMTSKNSVAAQNRFIYYPDHLVCMPGPGSSPLKRVFDTLTQPIFKGIFPGIVADIGNPLRPPGLEDESVGSFVSRRFGPLPADNLVSALLHGIYAGDIYQLSVRAVLPSLWAYERHGNGSVILGLLHSFFEGRPLLAEQDLHVERDTSIKSTPEARMKLAIISRSSVYTFKNGIGELANKLETKLQENPNVTLRRNSRIEQLALLSESSEPKIQIVTQSNTTSPSPKSKANHYQFTHVISTISSKTLNSITQPSNSLAPFSQTPSVTVMVVNLFYANPSLLPVHGFGYLLPRSLPFSQNPERALGVIFDSDATIGQDSIPGTKVTVMLGGHWWDGWDTYPDEEEGASMAKAILGRHLGIAEEPQAVRVGLQRECIPQYTVGHGQRMKEADLLLRRFQNRLRVAGNSYTGVGLNDCVRAAKDVVMGLVNRTGTTGLEYFADGQRWIQVKKNT